jgi:hypothetical protein
MDLERNAEITNALNPASVIVPDALVFTDFLLGIQYTMFYIFRDNTSSRM